MPHFLVIAASSTIGQAVVKQLLNRGDTVFTTARNNTKIIPNKYLDWITGQMLAIDGGLSNVRSKMKS